MGMGGARFVDSIGSSQVSQRRRDLGHPLRLVGREDSRNERDVGLGIKVVTYSYDKEGFQLIGVYPTSDPLDPDAILMVHLVYPAKAR
jgi:hypothetical protein